MSWFLSPTRSLPAVDKQRRRVEAEKEELQAALEEAEASLEQEENKVNSNNYNVVVYWQIYAIGLEGSIGVGSSEARNW